MPATAGAAGRIAAEHQAGGNADHSGLTGMSYL